MNKNTLIVIILIVLIVLSGAQVVEIGNLKNKVSSGSATYSNQQQQQVNAPSSQAPAMIGGC